MCVYIYTYVYIYIHIIYIYIYTNICIPIFGDAHPHHSMAALDVKQRPGVGHSRGDAVFALLRSHHVHRCSVTDNCVCPLWSDQLETM